MKVYIFDLDNTLYMHHMCVTDEYYSTLKTTLIKLKNDGIKLAIATHNINPISYLKKIQIDELFDVIISEKRHVHHLFNSIEDYTPKTEMIEEIMKILDCEKKDIIFLDDSSYNIKIVDEFNVKTIKVSPVSGINFNDLHKSNTNTWN